MKGQIRKRGNTYSVIVPLGKDTSGKKRYKWVTCQTKREAEAKRAELIHQANTGMLASPKGTLGEFVERWLEEYAKPNVSPTTAETYVKIARAHIIPVLGKIPLKDLKPEHLQHFYSERLGKGLSPATIRHHHMLLHKALNDAVKWGLLARNIVDAVSPPLNTRKEMRILDDTEINKVLSESRDNKYFILFAVDLMTGLRRSEILGLQWTDVDLVMAELSVTRSLHRLTTGETIYRPPKTAKSRRTVALSPATCQLFREHLQKMMDICSRLNIPFTNDRLVFSEPDGSPFRPDTITQAWHRMMKRLNINGVRFHDIRHSHASLMLKQGIHPKIVQERLGHSTIAVTLDTYSHVTPGLQRAAAERLDSFIDVQNSKRIAKEVMSSK